MGEGLETVLSDNTKAKSPKNNRISLYLAHPTADRDYVRKVELELEERLGIDLINPFYDVKNEEIKLLDSGKQVGDSWTKEISGKIVQNDLDHIKRAKGVLGFVTPGVSIGLPMEVFYNSYVLKRPTYLIVTKPGLLHHPWLKHFAAEIFESPEEFSNWWGKNHKKTYVQTKNRRSL